mgnify:FL=1
MLGVGSAHHTFVRPGTEKFDQEMHELHMKRMPDMRREKLNLQADAEVLVKRIAENGCQYTRAEFDQYYGGIIFRGPGIRLEDVVSTQMLLINVASFLYCQ